MKTKTYKQAGAISSSKTNWPSNEGKINQQPANDSRTHSRDSTFGNIIQNRFNQTVANKLLARKRRRSRHPLQDLRLQGGHTLEELAKLTKLSPSYLSRLESGTRRLNADILQRLANILSCHPGDLLPNDFYGNKFNSSIVHLSEPEAYEQGQGFSVPRLNAPDLPLYQLKTLNDKVCTIEFEAPSEWINRPHALVGVPGAISFQVSGEYGGSRYRPGDHIFAHPTRPLSQNCSVLVITHDNRAYVGEFIGWSSHHEHNDCITLRVYRSSKTQPASNDDLVNIDNNSMKVVYRVIGVIEAA